MTHGTRGPLGFVAILGVALSLPATAGPRGADAPVHLITCASPRALRDYQDGLKDLYQGKWEDAVAEFESASKRDPACAMAHWGRSRALHRGGKPTEALAAAARSEELKADADDREQRLIGVWHRYLQTQAKPEAERRSPMNGILADADLTLTLYPDDPECWLARADISPSPLRAAPFFLAAFRIQPQHPAAKGWKAPAAPFPTIIPMSVKPVPPVAEPPMLYEGLGKLTHPMTTKNPQAQAYYEQGLRCWHSYVSPMSNKKGAGVNFQHAANLDPDAPLPYWGLSLVATNGDVIKPMDAAQRCLDLALKFGSDKEKRIGVARILELSGGNKREEFLDVLDGAIVNYPEDVELWIWRGKAYGTGAACMPYQLAAYRLAPEHPSPNHELVHAFEGIDRPALGFPHSWGYRKSAPNMPHANHMQAHLAMRLGRWEVALDCTRSSRRTSLAGFPELDPSHHIDTMIKALSRAGHFQEAEAEPRAYRDGLPWARLLQLKADNQALTDWATRRSERNSPDGFYIGALARLNAGDLAAVPPLLAKVEEQYNKNREANLYRFNEVKGRYLVQTGSIDEGLKMLQDAGKRAVKDSGLHAWGGGSYVLEVWGEAALAAGRLDEAEEAFHEALAHEHGSIVGALGMQVVWERRGKSDMVKHYADLASYIWRSADAGSLERQLQRIRTLAKPGSPVAVLVTPVTEGTKQ